MSKKQIVSRLKYQFGDGSFSPNLLREYQELITEARSSGYDVIAIKYPIHPYYDSLVKNNQYTAKLDHMMDSLAIVNNLTILDFSSVMKDAGLFRDPDHLNLKGSAVFIEEFRKKFSNWN